MIRRRKQNHELRWQEGFLTMKQNEIKQKIFQAYLTLAKEPDAPINVRKITELAGIARSTFYSHYDNIDQLIIDLENDFLYDIEEIFTQHPVRQLESTLSLLARGLQSRYDTLQVLLTSKEGNIFLLKLNHTLKTLLAQFLTAQKIPFSNIQLTFAVTGLLSITDFLEDSSNPPRLQHTVEEYTQILQHIFS